MKWLVIICVILTLGLRSQDKVFFANGTVQNGWVVSIAKEFVYFKTTDTSRTQQLKKSDVLMIETYKGERYIFEKKPERKNDPPVNNEPENKIRNFLGAQPLAVFLGRVTLVYERTSKNGKIGLVLPFSLTFNPFNVFYESVADSTPNATPPVTGLNYILGADLNFYFGKMSKRQFFIGPRFRYGTDQMLEGTEGYSLQSQFGWRFNSVNRLTRHLSLGFGFVKVLSATPGTGIDPKQSYVWYSINYRFSFRW